MPSGGQYYVPLWTLNGCVVLDSGYFRKVNEILYWKKLFRYFRIRWLSARVWFPLPITLNTLIGNVCLLGTVLRSTMGPKPLRRSRQWLFS
jgi:hypothetical protein